mmetsp:Transcript_751/g.1868  ORF Transcript_751/g.1868 Transcript_751/m.1868 type:complete len:214 (-) Transcript_751:2108-2749(-)
MTQRQLGTQHTHQTQHAWLPLLPQTRHCSSPTPRSSSASMSRNAGRCTSLDIAWRSASCCWLGGTDGGGGGRCGWAWPPAALGAAVYPESSKKDLGCCGKDLVGSCFPSEGWCGSWSLLEAGGGAEGLPWVCAPLRMASNLASTSSLPPPFLSEVATACCCCCCCCCCCGDCCVRAGSRKGLPASSPIGMLGSSGPKLGREPASASVAPPSVP